jgi:hypothetical protein
MKKEKQAGACNYNFFHRAYLLESASANMKEKEKTDKFRVQNIKPNTDKLVYKRVETTSPSS